MENVTDFEKISDIQDLITYLKNDAERFENTKYGDTRYMYHYTDINAAISILKNGFWYLGSPKYMNDKLEYGFGCENDWENLFFGSFMYNVPESIGMWSMYAQPWEQGVILKVPVADFKKWKRAISKGTASVYLANPKTKEKTAHLLNESEFEVYINGVVYSNAKSKMTNESEKTYYRSRKNDILKNLLQNPLLLGYIKDNAWSYEQETRLTIKLNAGVKSEALSIKIPDEVIKQIGIVYGPKFIGDKNLFINNGITNSTEHSLFTNRLDRIYCDRCKK